MAKQVAKSGVQVVNQVTTLIRNGKDTYTVQAVEKGIAVSVGETSLTIPQGEAGKAILEALNAQVGSVVAAPKAKRTRRTKAQIEADKAKALAEVDAEVAADTAQ